MKLDKHQRQLIASHCTNAIMNIVTAATFEPPKKQDDPKQMEAYRRQLVKFLAQAGKYFEAALEVSQQSPIAIAKEMPKGMHPNGGK